MVPRLHVRTGAAAHRPGHAQPPRGPSAQLCRAALDRRRGGARAHGSALRAALCARGGCLPVRRRPAWCGPGAGPFAVRRLLRPRRRAVLAPAACRPRAARAAVRRGGGDGAGHSVDPPAEQPLRPAFLHHPGGARDIRARPSPAACCRISARCARATSPSRPVGPGCDWTSTESRCRGRWNRREIAGRREENGPPNQALRAAAEGGAAVDPVLAVSAATTIASTSGPGAMRSSSRSRMR